MVDKPRFAVSQALVGRATVLSVRGEVDALTAPSLAEAIFAARAEQPSAVIVDLASVDFLASAGMTVLIDAHNKLTPAVQFLVVADGPGTSRPLKLMGIDSLLGLYPTLDDALGAIASIS